MTRITPTVLAVKEAHFWARVDRSAGPDGCWPWVGTLQENGYGALHFHGRRTNPHRVAYEHVVGPIPTALTLDHLCRNRACCNPAHLEAVTAAENKRRGFSPAAIRARQTHCKRGHPLDPPGSGRRWCRLCKRINNQVARRARWEARHAAA